ASSIADRRRTDMSRRAALLVSVRSVPPAVAAAGAALGALLLWAYWPVCRDMARKWLTDPQYSHGYLVPLFSVALLVLRRDRAAGLRATADWRGLPLLAAAAAGYVAGGYLDFDWLTAGSLVAAGAGGGARG